MTEPANNLTTKFTALSSTLGGKLDSILTKLDDLATKLDASADYSAIISAIRAIRGGTHTLTTLASRLDNIQSITGSQNSNLMDILFAIGDISTNPANYTVRDLLALVETSIGTQPPDNQEVGNDASDSTWLRQLSWKEFMPRSYSGTLYNVYSPVFSPISNPYTLVRKDSSDNKRSLYLCDYGGTSTMSVAWNTTDHVSPVFVAKLRKTLVIAGEFDNSFDEFSFISDCGMYPYEGNMQATGSMDATTSAVNAQACGDGDTVVEWFVLYPDGVVPIYLDFFWKAW